MCQPDVQPPARLLASFGFSSQLGGSSALVPEPARSLLISAHRPGQDAVSSFAAAQPLTDSALWTFRNEWEMVPGSREFIDEGAERQRWMWAIEFVLAVFLQDIFQILDDVCCVLFFF